MKRLIKKMPHRQGLEDYILAYANEKDGMWDYKGEVEMNGETYDHYECVSSGSKCIIPDDDLRGRLKTLNVSAI